MTNPAYGDLVNDLGNIQTNFYNGTTALKSFIAKAQVRIKGITGTTTGYDNEIRNMADANAIQSLLVSLGPESVGNDSLVSARDNFIKDVEQDLMVGGFTIKGQSVKFKQVNG